MSITFSESGASDLINLIKRSIFLLTQQSLPTKDE